MRKLLRDKTTGAFLTSAGEWTEDKPTACDFFNHPGCFDVVEFARSKHLEWYYWFEAPGDEYDFTTDVDWHALKLQ